MASPPAAFAGLWQLTQFCSRIGAMSLLKSVCPNAETVRSSEHNTGTRLAPRVPSVLFLIFSLHKLRNPGFGARPHLEAPVPIELLGKQLVLRVESLLPRHLLAGIGGHAAHHRQQGAGGHALAVIHRLV